MMQGMGADQDRANDYGLAAALAAHPDGLVTGITLEGAFCPMPPELGATHAILPGTNAFDVVPQSEWAHIGAGWLRVFQYGSYVGATLDNEGNRISMAAYDARERFGMVIMLVTYDVTLGEVSTDRQLPVVARFGTYHRDLLAGVTAMDEGAEGLLGWSLEEIAAWTSNDLIHADDQANALENWLGTLGAPGSPQRWRGRHLHQDGTYRWIEFTNTNRVEELGYVVSEMMDISEEMATAEALREQKELLARLNEALPLGVCQIDRDRNLVYANNQLYELAGRQPGEDLALLANDIDPEDQPVMMAAVDAVIEHGLDRTFEIRIKAPDGDVRMCLVNLRALRDAADAVTGAVLCISDITEAAMLRSELERQATFDLLTGCHNRASTMASLEHSLADAHRSGRGTAVIFIDLDRFKPVNDELGHAAGDRLLVTFAERLRAIVRDGDLVGRVGGDEFLVVCPGAAGPDTAVHIAQRITADLAEPVVLFGRSVSVGASVGVAWTDDLEATADSLVATADAAMYRSKRAGRSEVVLAS